jgi:parallel beta-helix repeat protein
MRKWIFVLTFLAVSLYANSTVITVDPNGTGDYPTIQAAIDAAVDNDVVVLNPGTYTGDENRDIIFPGKAITVRSTDPNNPDIVASTVIDCQGSETSPHRGIFFDWEVDSSTILDGITITNGHADEGGAILCDLHAAPHIRRCRLINNTADRGGAILCNTDNIIELPVVIDSCIIKNNTAISEGGGIHTFYQNGLDLRNSVISGNKAGADGGGIWMYGNNGRNNVQIKNCTITGNSALNEGGGLYISGHEETVFENNILWNNQAFFGQDLYYSPGGFPNAKLLVQYSLLDPLKAYSGSWINYGDGHINADPNFADPGHWDDNGTPADQSDDIWIHGDYHLKSQAGRWDPNSMQWVTDAVTSPCVDTGNPADDWRVEFWPHGGRINMGAYGNTPEASMSLNAVGNIADLDHNNEVNINDFMLFSGDWLYAKYLLDTDLNRNGVVDIADFADFANEWLWP